MILQSASCCKKLQLSNRWVILGPRRTYTLQQALKTEAVFRMRAHFVIFLHWGLEVTIVQFLMRLLF